jgi:hypothetical protein
MDAAEALEFFLGGKLQGCSDGTHRSNDSCGRAV